MPKKAFYFKHDFFARNDHKIAKMFTFCGTWEYYGVFWCIIEVLAAEKNYRFPIKEMQTLSQMISVPISKIRDVVTMFDLFVIDNDEGYFYSESLIERMEEFESKSKKAKESIRIRWDRERAKKNGLLLIDDISTDVKEDNIEVINSINNIELPIVPFLLSTAAENSWRACLFACNSTYDEIKKSYYHIQEDEFISYKKFNEMIDSENGETDFRYIRISGYQVLLQPYVKLIHKYQDRSLIKDALVKMVRNGIKPEYIIYNKIEQFIQYVQEDRAKGLNNKATTVNQKNIGRQLINGFYHINGDKYLTVNLDDMEQCQQLIKIYRQEEMTYEQIREKREELGDNKFRIFLGY